MKNVLKPLRLTAAASATDATIQKKFYFRYENMKQFRMKNWMVLAK